MSVSLFDFLDVKDDRRQSPLDVALDNPFQKGSIDVAFYLFNCAEYSCSRNIKSILQNQARYWGRRDIIKDLAEQNPNGEWCLSNLRLNRVTFRGIS